MEKLRDLASNLRQEYRGEWRHGAVYNKNDIVRVNGAAYVCTTDYYSEHNKHGYNYKPEHDSSGWQRYSAGYCWTGQWKPKGEYYPGDIVNYNGERHVCLKHGKYIHPIFDNQSATTYWNKLSTNANQNKSNRVIGFWNRNPLGWNPKHGSAAWASGEITSGNLGTSGITYINGNYEVSSSGYRNDYSFGASEFGYGGQQDGTSASVFQRYDEYDGYRPPSPVDPGIFGSRGRIIQGVGDQHHMWGYLFDTGEVFWSGWMGSGEHGDGGTTNRYYTRRVGRTSNMGGSFNYNQQIQQYQGSFAKRGQGLLRDIQAIKLSTSCTSYARNSSSSCGALDIDGQIWTWGYNGHTGLGRNFRYNNNWYNSYVPAKIPQNYFDNRKIIDFWMGGGNYQYGHALDEDGNLWGWGHNSYDHLGTGSYWRAGSPTKIPYDWQKHGGIKKYCNEGYNTYYRTLILTHDGVLHTAGYAVHAGRSFFGSTDYNDDWSNYGGGFSPMQKFWWDRARSMGVSGAELRSLWNVTDLYNDVEDFWHTMDQGNSSIWIKQKSTGMIYVVGQQSYYRLSTVDWLIGDAQDTGDNIWSNAQMQYPHPMQMGYSDVIQVARSGDGNNEWRWGLFLDSSGRAMTAGNGDGEARGRGNSVNSVAYEIDGRNKLPWELNSTSTYGTKELPYVTKMADICSGSANDGFFAITEDDKLMQWGEGSGFDPSRLGIPSYMQGRMVP